MSTLIKSLVVYTSEPASPQMATFLRAAAQGLHLDIRPTTALPAPDPLRRPALRVERTELLASIALAEHFLGLYQRGERQPDAGNESGLRFDLEALRNRLRAVDTVLGLHAPGADNA